MIFKSKAKNLFSFLANKKYIIYPIILILFFSVFTVFLIYNEEKNNLAIPSDQTRETFFSRNESEVAADLSFPVFALDYAVCQAVKNKDPKYCDKLQGINENNVDYYKKCNEDYSSTLYALFPILNQEGCEQFRSGNINFYYFCQSFANKDQSLCGQITDPMQKAICFAMGIDEEQACSSLPESQIQGCKDLSFLFKAIQNKNSDLIEKIRNESNYSIARIFLDPKEDCARLLLPR